MRKIKIKVIYIFFTLLLFNCIFTLNNVKVNAANASATNGNGTISYILNHRMYNSSSSVSVSTSNSKNVNRVTTSFTIKNYYTGGTLDSGSHSGYGTYAAGISAAYPPTSAVAKQPTSAFSSHTTVHTYGYSYYLSQPCQ